MVMTDNSGSKNLMQAFFSPAVALMNRLDITRKFVLLGLMSLVAIAVVVHSLFASLEQDISFSQRELKGLKLVELFPRTVHILQQHRGLSVGLFGGDENMRDSRASTERKVAEALDEMLGQSFPGMNPGEDLQHIKADWELLRKEGLSWSAAENFAAHTRLIARIQSFEGIVADEYALILDPELSTFYLIDTIVNKLPHALEHLGRLRAYGTGVLAKKQASEQQKIEMSILIAKLDDAIALLKTNLDKAGRYNPALQGVISTASMDIADSARQVAGSVTTDILSGQFATQPDTFSGMSTAAIDRSYSQLYEELLPMAETLIRERIARAENTLRFSVGTAFLLFLAAAYFSVGVSRAIIVNIRSIARSAHAFAGGDLLARVELDTRDELGEIGNSFNEMAFMSHCLLVESRENEARLHDQSVHLEERVKERTRELRESEANFRQLFERHSDVMLLIDHQSGIIVDANPAAAQFYGYPLESLRGMNVSQINAQIESEIHPQRQQAINGERAIFFFDHRLANGAVRAVEVHISTVNYKGKSLFFSIIHDITERKKAEEQLRVAAATFETHEAILITDANANIIRVNHAFQETTGYSPEEVMGKNPRILSSGRQDKAFYAEMWGQLLKNGSWTGEMWDRRKNGQVYPKWATITAVKDGRGQTTEYVAIFSDITARKEAEEEIRNLAFYDALTKLPNRRLLLDRFHLALSVSARSHHYGAVLFLDMDKFKVLNDTLGHDYGDLMLVEVAERIQFCVREMDTVARLGGDEFVVLVEEVDTGAEQASQKVALIAEKIRAALAVPYQIKGHEHHSSPSIGVCLYRGNEQSVDTLLKHADLAMYQAKEAGRNTVRFFDPAMQHAVEMHAALEADLRRAIPNQELRLFYQIQVNSEYRPLGAEALVRWEHPRRGMVSPAQFIPVAEESSLILDIGHWVLDIACRQLAQWSESERTRHLTLAINVSAQQFRLHNFVDRIATALHTHHVDPSYLKLELTESVVLDDVTDVVTKMHALKSLGVKLSLDDFGTGYSSLSYLKQLPLDQIKIDQGFVRDIATDPNDAVMVQTIIGMAQNFRLNVIAEGVETEAQLNFLMQNGCLAYQGYLFGKPVPIGEFEALLGKLQGN